MIRQAHTYLVSAMSGATLIAIAIVAFVLLVSAQVFRDWPIAALGENEASISDSRATSSPQQAPTTNTAANSTAAVPQSTGSGSGNGGGNGGRRNQSSGDESTSGGPTATTSPVETGNTGSGGNQGGNDAPSSSPAQAPSSTGTSSGSSQGSSGGKTESGSPATTTTGKLTETVNETVNKVDETVTGGALEKTGVTEVTEGVVNGVVGPESAVGKVVDGTVEAVGGLLGGKK